MIFDKKGGREFDDEFMPEKDGTHDFLKKKEKIFKPRIGGEKLPELGLQQDLKQHIFN